MKLKVANALVHGLQFTIVVDLVELEDQRFWLEQVGELSRLWRSNFDKENAILGPRNYCELSIIVDLQYEFEDIPETQGVCGKSRSSRRSSP